MDPQEGPFVLKPDEASKKEREGKKKKEETAKPSKKKGAEASDATRPLDEGKIGEPAPAPRVPRGKPFSPQRQGVLKGTAMRLKKAKAQHKEAQTKSRKLGELVRTLDGLLLEEVLSNTEMLDFDGAEKKAAARARKATKKKTTTKKAVVDKKKKAAADKRAAALATGSKNKRDASGKKRKPALGRKIAKPRSSRGMVG